MKKLMFACACAVSLFAMADGNYTGFEILAGTTDLGNKNDSGQEDGPYYFSYERASGSTDGSIIKAYGNPDCLPTFDYTKKLPAAFISDTANDDYLELSTEGGTLWRNFTTAGDIGGEEAGGFEGEHMLGDPVSLTDLALENSTVYVDTLVQFTPTEDGTAPTVASADQMAIWLNVDSTDPDAPVTNLCVLASQLSGSTCDPLVKTFTVSNADVVPGKWYRLTVKTIADISTTESGFPGFMVYLDGKLLKTDTPTMDAEAAETYDGYLNVSMSDIANGSVFCSLCLTADGYDGHLPTFTAVGFKGSGALDDLVVSTDVPNIFESAGALDFILTFDANVSAVTYTIDGADYQVSAEAIAAGMYTVEGVEGGTEVNVQATAKDWYEVKRGAGITTINEDGQTIAIWTGLADTPADAGATGLDGVDTAAAKAWADAKGLTIAQIKDSAFAKNAFLMNTDLSAAPGLEITAIEEVEDGWQITVKGTQGETDVTLGNINGQLQVMTAETLAGLATATPQTYDIELTVGGAIAEAKIVVPGNVGNFMKATVGMKSAPAAE